MKQPDWSETEEQAIARTMPVGRVTTAPIITGFLPVHPHDEPGPNPLLSAALHYATNGGWPVFPCMPLGKAPLGRLVPHGFKDASIDPDRIRYWWREEPRANIAVACGAPGPDALDIDTKHGRAGLELFQRMRRAGLARGGWAIVHTPSGGLHVWFQGTNQPGGAVGGSGKPLELKAVGGYVLLPPSYVVIPSEGIDGEYVLGENDSERLGPIDWSAVRQLLAPPPTVPVRRARPRPVGGPASPGDDYNRRVDWADILLPAGWTFVRERGGTGYWWRPEKTEGTISATTNHLGTDRLRVFTTSTGFNAESYSKFGAYAVLHHRGDHGAAARELRRLGYGGQGEQVAA